MSILLKEFDDILQIAGLKAATCYSYGREIRLQEEFYGKGADEITEVEFKDYVLHRKNVDQLSRSAINLLLVASRHFFNMVVPREWPVLKIAASGKAAKLPIVLSKPWVDRILGAVQRLQYRAYFQLVYSCGLRMSEGRNVQVGHLEKGSNLLRVDEGKGSKDRMVPIPDVARDLLKDYWRTHRNPVWIFPAPGRGRQDAPTATRPLGHTSVQKAFAKIKEEVGLHIKGVGIHTLRHCYATHLLEAGVNVHLIQRYMGHASLDTTMRYFHLTRCGQEDAFAIINDVMGRLDR